MSGERERPAAAYLDHNATTPVRPEVLEAMLPWLKEGWANPNSVYAAGQKARAAVERAREQVAALVGSTDPSEIVFTSGGSEADALALSGAAWQAREESGGRRRRVVSSAIEHDAVRVMAKQLAGRGFEAVEAPCGPDGAVAADAFARLLGEDCAVATLMHANNETGVLQPVAECAAAARAKGAAFHVDAVQSAGKVVLDVRALGADSLALSGHKLGAPKGVGALWARRGLRLAPLVTGHQEKNRRGGTENVAGIVAFGAACELGRRELETAAARALAQRRRVEEAALRIPGSLLSGHPERRLPNTAHFTFEGLDGHHLVVALDLEGICVSSGPACSSGSSLPSHVLTAMGVPDRLATGCLRVSVGHGTTDAEVDRFAQVLPRAVERLRRAEAVA